jgi:hypothetical protein
VDGPNSLWQYNVDGKIRWKIHGGIDGHSRTIVYLCCATNNTAATVLSAFRTVVELFGATKGEIRSGWGEY